MKIELTPKLQTPVQTLQVSPTLRINQFIKEKRSQGACVAHFGFGQSPFQAPELMVEALKECASFNHYLPTQGLPQLREAIVDWLKHEFSVDAQPSQVFIGPGSKECLFQLLMMLEGEVLIPQGSWVSYQPQAKILNKPVSLLPTYEKDRYCLSAEVLKAHVTQNTHQKLLILNNPNNPTGQIYDPAELKEITKVCRKNNVIVISDEIYNRVLFEPDSFQSIQRFYPEGTVVTNGISKSFSGGGYRLGFALLPKNFESMFCTYNSLISETYSAVSTPIQYAATSLYQHFSKIKPYLDCCNHIHRWVLNYTYEQLSQLGFASTKPQAGFYLLVHLNEHRQALKKMSISTNKELCQHILENYGVAVLPASEFYFSDSFLGFRLSPVDYDGSVVLPVFSSQNAEMKLSEWFPNIKFGLDQLANFIHAVNQQ